MRASTPTVPHPEFNRRMFADSNAACPLAAHSRSCRSYRRSLSEGPCRMGGVCVIIISVIFQSLRRSIGEADEYEVERARHSCDLQQLAGEVRDCRCLQRGAGQAAESISHTAADAAGGAIVAPGSTFQSTRQTSHRDLCRIRSTGEDMFKIYHQRLRASLLFNVAISSTLSLKIKTPSPSRQTSKDSSAHCP